MKPIHYLYEEYEEFCPHTTIGYYTACKVNTQGSNRMSKLTEYVTCKNCRKTRKFKSDNYV